MRSKLALAAATTLFALAGLAPKAADTDVSPLAELAWLEGTWRIEADGQVLEETYGPPLGNSITGTFRWLREDAAFVYEFLLIEAQGDEIKYHLRHFGPGSIGHESKDQPMTYELVSMSEDEMVIENLELSPQRMIFTREGADRLDVVLEKEHDGKVERDELPFERKRP